METIELSNVRSIRSNEISQQELTSQRSRTSHGSEKKIMMISDTIIASCFIYRSQWAAENLPNFME